MTTASPPQNLNSMDEIEVYGESDLNTRAVSPTNKPEGESELVDLVDEVNNGENESVDIMDEDIHYVKDVNDETGQVGDDEPLIEWDDVELLFLKTSYDKLHLADIKYAPSEEKVNSLLDIVMLKGGITKEHKNYLKGKFRILLEGYITKRSRVNNLCQTIRDAYKTLDSHKELEKTFTSLPKLQDAQVKFITKTNKGGMCETKDIKEERFKLMSYENKLLEYNEQITRTNNIVNMLTEERDWLKEELVKMDGQCIDEKHVKLMHSEFCKERGFVDMKCQEIKELEFKLQKLNISVQKEELKNESKTESLGLLEDKISGLKTKISLTKEINTQIQKHFNEDSKRLQSLEGEIDASRSKYVKLKEDMDTMKVELEKAKAVEKQELPQLKMKHKSIDELTLRLSEVNERYCHQMGKQETISMRLKCSEIEQKKAIVNQIQYERDKEKVTALLSIAIARYNSDQQNVKEIQSQYHNLTVIKANMPRNDKRMKEQRRKLVEEIEAIKQRIIQENKAASHDTELLKAIVKEVSIVQEEVWHVQKNINTLVSNVNLIALERQDQLNRCQRLKQQLEQLWGDGRILDIHLDMSSKALDVELRQLESLKNDCDHFRTERNKDYHHMLVMQQQVVEHRERYKMIVTEVENLKALSNQRERQLNKLYVKLESENKDRKTLCNQLVAWTRQLKDTKLEKEAASEKVRQLHRGIAKCRHEGSILQKEYSTIVSERNLQGLKLRDMLEEAVIFQEQIKTFQDMIKRADSELEQRLEVIQRMEVIRRMEANTVGLLKKFIKRNKNSAKKLVKVSEELEQVTAKEFELETKFELGNRHKMTTQMFRVNIYDNTTQQLQVTQGKSIKMDERILAELDEEEVCESRAWKEDPDKLRKKLQQLERRVIAKEAKVVELKLVQDRVEGLILKLQQELTIMQEACQGTIQTSSQQKKTEGLCRQAKALVSELALAHTSVKHLKLESRLKHEKLDLVKKHLDQVVADHSKS